MPSSPKLFYSRPSSYSRRSTALVLCLLMVLLGLVFVFVAISPHGLGHDCKLGKPLSASVRWDNTGAGSPGEGPKRHKVMGFVGIQTGFGSAGRRGALRRTWFPSDREVLKRLEESTGLAFRFVIGRTSDASKMSELKKEVAKYDDFLLLDIEEYNMLPYKTCCLELGCLEKKTVSRCLANEDVTIGSWMLAMNVSHEDNRKLCVAECTPSSIAVWDIPKCSGLCNPEKKMLELHGKDNVRRALLYQMMMNIELNCITKFRNWNVFLGVIAPAAVTMDEYFTCSGSVSDICGDFRTEANLFGTDSSYETEFLMGVWILKVWR